MTSSQKKEEKSSLVPTVAGTLIGLAVGAAIGVLITGAGDEAPIRVKNGSTKLEVVHKNAKFKEKGNKKNFEIKDGAHGSENFEVYFAPSGNEPNCTARKADGSTIEIVANSGNKITISAPNNKTQVVSDNDLTLDVSSEQFLEYGTTNDYVKSITVKKPGQPDVTCVLQAKDDGLSVVLLDK